MTGDRGTWLVLEELLERGDPEFVVRLRAFHDADRLKAFAPTWHGDSTVHRWFQRWCRRGVMERIWAALVADCDELQGVDWEWQSAEGALAKARFGGLR
jgi:transposase